MKKLVAEEFKGVIAFSLACQFQSMWKMLRQGIEKVPEEQWTQGLSGDDQWFYSLRVYHIIETSEFYLRDSPEGMKWGQRLGKVNWWKTISHQEVAQKITKKDTLAYLEEIEERIVDFLKGINDQALMDQDGFRTHIPTILEKYIYLLRHNNYHIGELTLRLRQIGCERIEWR